MSYTENTTNRTFLEVRKELKNYKTKLCDSTNVSKKLMCDIELKHFKELIEIKKKHIREMEIFIRDYKINSFVMNNCDRITRTIINGMENNKNEIIAKVKFVIPQLLNFLY
jgi:DNA-binding XRE family transcriptional regulator